MTDGATYELRTVNRRNGNTKASETRTRRSVALASTSTGQLWGTDAGALYEINKATPPSTNLAPSTTAPTTVRYLWRDRPSSLRRSKERCSRHQPATPLGLAESVDDSYNPGLAGVTVRMYQRSRPSPANRTPLTFSTPPRRRDERPLLLSSVPAGAYWITVDSSTMVPEGRRQRMGRANLRTDRRPVFRRLVLVRWRQPARCSEACGQRYPTTHPASFGRARVGSTAASAKRSKNIDFGFSFNVVTNLEGGDRRPSLQGSLRQFITNANTVTGPNPMRFVPVVPTNATDGGTNDWWSLASQRGFPPIATAATTIDGAAFDAADGITALDTNASGPELELQRRRRAAATAWRSRPSNSAGPWPDHQPVQRTGIARSRRRRRSTIAGNYIGPDATGCRRRGRQLHGRYLRHTALPTP